MLKKVCVSIFTQALSIYLISRLLDGIHIGSLEALLILSLFLGILNRTIKPILKVIAFPITVLSLGLFKLIINGFVLYLAFALTSNTYIDSIGTAVVGFILISLTNSFLDIVLD